MHNIKNFDSLATTPQRKIVLELIEEALLSIQPEKIVQKNLSITKNVLKIQDKLIELNNFKRIFLLGFGKGSAVISRCIEEILEDFLTEGYVIDLEPQSFSKIEFTKGTHPLPSENNLIFTKKAIEQFSPVKSRSNRDNGAGNLTIEDLVIVVIAGGGSALFESPYKISLDKLIEVNKSLLRSGATITEMNIVRKHLSKVKGGGLAKLLYPAKVVSLIASDVPGNDLSVIASGPTVKDPSTKQEAFDILAKYSLWNKLNLSEDDFLETPKEEMYFQNTQNILLLSNQTALNAMQEKAKELGFNSIIYSDRFQSEAKFAGKKLIDQTPPNSILLIGGETTVKVLNKGGLGGRNQEVVLAALLYVGENITIASFDSDGWDNSKFAGAIGDSQTLKKAKSLSLNPQEFLATNNTLPFFEKTWDGIITDRLPSNVSDLMVVMKK